MQRMWFQITHIIHIYFTYIVSSHLFDAMQIIDWNSLQTVYDKLDNSIPSKRCQYEKRCMDCPVMTGSNWRTVHNKKVSNQQDAVHLLWQLFNRTNGYPLRLLQTLIPKNVRIIFKKIYRIIIKIRLLEMIEPFVDTFDDNYWHEGWISIAKIVTSPRRGLK